MVKADPHRARWETTRVVAQIWHCYDDDCDCVQPIIERITPGKFYPWVDRERIWEGTYVSLGNHDPNDPSIEDLQNELRAACRANGLPEVDTWGEWIVDRP